MLSVAELDDEVDFDGVFSNYGNPSPLKLRRDIVVCNVRECPPTVSTVWWYENMHRFGIAQ